jgi:hypothetical protein
LAAIAAFIGGAILIAPSVAAQTEIQSELLSSGGVPTEEQRQRLERAASRIRLASRIDLPLLSIAVLTMAVGRYL